MPGSLVTFATLDPAAGRKGITAFLLEPQWAGITRTPFKNKVGFRPLESGELVLDNVRVPVANRLGEEGEGFKIAMSSVESGRLTVAARCIGMMPRALRWPATTRQRARPSASRSAGASWCSPRSPTCA